MLASLQSSHLWMLSKSSPLLQPPSRRQLSTTLRSPSFPTISSSSLRPSPPPTLLPPPSPSHHPSSRLFSTTPSNSFPPRTAPSSPYASTPAAPPISFFPSPSQIHVLPFIHSRVEAAKEFIFNQAYFAPSGSWQAVKDAWASRTNTTHVKELELVRLDAVYLPGWAVDAKITIGVETESEDELELNVVPIETEKFFFPGNAIPFLYHVTCTPLLSELPSTLKIFNPSTDLIHDTFPVEAIPFDVSPLPLLDLLRMNAESLDLTTSPSSSSSSKKETSTTKTTSHRIHMVDMGKRKGKVGDIDMDRFDCVPLYLPFWVARYKVDGDEILVMIEDSREKIRKCPVLLPSSMSSDLDIFNSPKPLYRKPSSSEPRANTPHPQHLFLKPASTSSLTDEGGVRAFEVGMQLKSLVEMAMETWLEEEETRTGLQSLSRMGMRGGLRGVGEGSKCGRIGSWEEMRKGREERERDN